jgi:YD repeat-containing protein
MHGLRSLASFGALGNLLQFHTSGIERPAATQATPGRWLAHCAAALALTAIAALGVPDRALAVPSNTDCMQDAGQGPVPCFPPTIGDWHYQSARCDLSYGPFGDEQSALTAGVLGEYIKGSGCAWDVANPGFWGTADNPVPGPCGSTQLFPQQNCTSDSQPLVQCGIETDDYRHEQISYLTGNRFSPPCSVQGLDGISVKRSRPVSCPANSEFVQLTDGSWLCRPRIEQSNLGKPCECGVGNPINPAVGNKYQEETDYVGGGPFPLVFVRSYNSRAVDRDLGLGAGWTSNYHMRLTIRTDLSTVSALRADGKSLVYVNSAGVWNSTSDVNDRLTPVAATADHPEGWMLSVAAGDRTEMYDAGGRLLSISERAGLTQQLLYDPQGRLRSVFSAFGRQLSFEYGPDGHVIAMHDPDPQSSVHTYAFQGGNLASVTYPDGTVRSYVYDDLRFPHALTGLIDENGVRLATWGYNEYGRPNSSEHAGGVDRVQISYAPGDTFMSPLRITDARNTTHTYFYDFTNRVARAVAISPACDKCGLPRNSQFDTNGNRTLVTDFNFVDTSYTYDLQRNLQTQRVDASNVAATRRFTNTQWHPQFRLPVVVAEPLRRTTYAYDDHGNVTRKTIEATSDANGSLGFSAPANGPARTWTYTYTYSSVVPGHVVRLVVDGPRTDVADQTTYDWDEQGNLASITNALGDVTTLPFYDEHGRLRAIIDPNGLGTMLTYDPRGRLLSRTEGAEVTHYAYDAVGQLTGVTMPDGSTLTYTYDGAHRLIAIQDSLGNRIAYTLDASGNRIQEQVFDPAQALVQTRSRAYDALDRLVQEIGGVNPATEITSYSYDAQGNVLNVIDPLGHVTSNVYDALNRVKQVIDPSGPGAGGVTQYAYDGLDHVTQVTDPRGLATSYTIDGLGETTRLASPDTGITSSAYDAAGNLTSQLDARGVVATFAYDALNRVTQALYTPPAGSGIAPVAIGYTYDVNALSPTGTERGRLTGISDPSGSTSYVHDIHGRLVSETRVIAGQTYATGYTYDAGGRLAGITYPSRRRLVYGFDAMGRIAQIDTINADGLTQTVVANVSYQPFGAAKSFTYGNASGSVRTFDLDGRVASYTLGGVARSVSYDDASRIVAFRHANAAQDQTFLYDNLDRLTNWTAANGNRSFSYDVVGNRLSETIGATTFPYSYETTSNRLSAVGGVGGTSYSYDPAGSSVSAGAKSFAYDARHRMIQALSGGQGATYQLNGLGQRVLKTPSAGAATVYHYDQAGRLIAESDTSGNVLVEYVYLGDVPVAVLQ